MDTKDLKKEKAAKTRKAVTDSDDDSCDDTDRENENAAMERLRDEASKAEKEAEAIRAKLRARVKRSRTACSNRRKRIREGYESKCRLRLEQLQKEIERLKKIIEKLDPNNEYLIRKGKTVSDLDSGGEFQHMTCDTQLKF